MDRPRFDLQCHSRLSDGALAPRQVVESAAASGVELLALTDHDTVAGVGEAMKAADDLGVRLVPAVEVSAVDDVGQDLHILGYLVDHADQQLLERLERWRGDRIRRGDAMVAALCDLGFEVDRTVLDLRSQAGKPIGRPHVAKAVVEHPANARRLAEERLEDPSAFLAAYLIEGRPGFCPRENPRVPDAIDSIHAAGGVAVWAHPFWDVQDPDLVLTTISRFRECGLDGVECFYVTHAREQAALLHQACSELDLLITGSSDFHGPEHRLFSHFRAFSTYGLEPNLGPIAALRR